MIVSHHRRTAVRAASALLFGVLAAIPTMAAGQAVPHPQPTPSLSVDPLDPEVEAERAKLRAILRQKQIEEDGRTFDRWNRWTYAVCVGCNPPPAGAHPVYTYPLRVLAGIPAYVDDARMPVRRRLAGLLPIEPIA